MLVWNLPFCINCGLAHQYTHSLNNAVYYFFTCTARNIHTSHVLGTTVKVGFYHAFLFKNVARWCG